MVQTGGLHLGFQCPIAEPGSGCSPMALAHRFVAFCDMLACTQHAIGVGTRKPLETQAIRTNVTKARTHPAGVLACTSELGGRPL